VSEPLPSGSAIPHVRPTPTYPALRADDNVQGNVLAGFNKDHQVFLFLQLPEGSAVRRYLRALQSRVTPNSAVAAFNQEFSAARRMAGGTDPLSLSTIWVGLALTAGGLEVVHPQAFAQLSDGAEVDPGVHAFLEGAASRAPAIGDVDQSDPATWLYGRPGQRIDAVVTIAADRPEGLALEVQRQRELAARHDAVVIFEQHGETLPGVRRGHEHFGFRDGISQPGIRGFDPPSGTRDGEVEGSPGMCLLAPGDFVLGYEREEGAGRAVPRWMWDGSFLVIRRLAQDVPGWWGHLGQIRSAANVPVERLAARAVGRWRSGAPVDRDPARDGAGGDRSRDNDFDYANDADAVRTAYFAHIRMMNARKGDLPRGESKPLRIMRRGIPFGPHFDPAAGRGHGEDADRGLLFVCYQTSIVEQFEALYRAWSAGGAASGSGPSEPRLGLTLSFRPFVCAQGGIYAFTPSLATLRAIVEGGSLA
jgi:Dyp-type peroxidase family